MGLLTRLTDRRDRMHPEPADAPELLEANRQYLIRIDPDAARILTTNAIDAHHSWKVNDAFTDEMAESVRAEAADLMRPAIAEAEAEPPADPELLCENAFVLPPPNLREGWLG